MKPTQTSCYICNIKMEIPQNDSTFALLDPPQNVYLMIPEQSKANTPTRDFGQRTIAKELADTCPKASREVRLFFQSQVDVNTFRTEVACRIILFGFA